MAETATPPGDLTPVQMREILASGRPLPRPADWSDYAGQAARDSNGHKAKAGRPAAKGQRFALFNAFVDYDLAGSTGAEAAVWIILWRDARKGISKTGQCDIARRAGVSRRAVGLAIKKLERRGLLLILYRGGLKRGISRYRVQASGVLSCAM